jgi:hypothetical protein
MADHKSMNNGQRDHGFSQKVAVGVSSQSGGLLLVSDRERKKWKKIGPLLKGESVNCLNYDPITKTLFATTHTNGVLVSKDLGKTWSQSNTGLHVKKTWTMASEARNPKIMYVGTQYGHLFKSSNFGEKWEEVTGLFEAPKRNEWGVDWGFGTVGLCIHTIKMDPRNRKRFYIVSSGGGPYRTDDGGKTWSLLNKGVVENCSIGTVGDKDPAENLAMHLAQVHKCTHKLVLSSRNPNNLYQQNHCGVYRSMNSGDTWEDISPGDNQRHGFPLALADGAVESLFTIPAYQGEGCKKHNSCIRGELAVYRSQDSGNNWEKMTNGFARKSHTCVLRDAMGVDLSESPGVYFGTTTGQVYASTDLGNSWTMILDGAGRVQGINAFAI